MVYVSLTFLVFLFSELPDSLKTKIAQPLFQTY